MPKFAHLHSHTQFSLLDGAAAIPALFKKASADGMPALAITDHGNMFGVFQFVAEAERHEGVKPIVGCEFYVVEDRHRKTFTKEEKDRRYHQLLLAKNATGYRNLVKLCSLGYIEGLYGKYPRIDKNLLLQYHEGLIATTCCLAAMVPQAILNKDEETARKEFQWWLDLFGEDYYIELQRHHMPEQDRVNEVLLRWAREYNVKVICTNDSHYVDQQDANAHDILLCVNTGEKQSTPPIREFLEEGKVTKGGRFAFWNDQFYFKTQDEMAALFHDVPFALENTLEIVDKCEHLRLKQDILLPHFVVPEAFPSQDDYLRHLTFEGARRRYGRITPEIEERLNFELQTIRTMGFAGYFLIVADFIQAGRELGVFIGPGRGSAAGSAVAYCIGITNVDPIQYGLLFERFLNPERKSMPDIDTDFDDEGRDRVIEYVVKKYGYQQVAQIVTYSSMAAKMSIKDVARVLDLPLDRSNALAKLVPERPGVSLRRVLKAPLDGEGSLAEKEKLNPDEIENCKRLRAYLDDEGAPEAKVLREALVLEGSVRGTGIHAAGIIIAPKDLTEVLPVFVSKETPYLITQYEGNTIEDAGVIKMDFLGLKNLTVIRDTVRLIEQNHGVRIDIDHIPLDDRKTYELYQRGETNGTFQFESAGMQKYLRELKPDKIEDLIAMNALYRPGPMEYIPEFIARKHGRKPITYDLPEMEEYLRETFGITVYQEQIMQLSQKLAGFSKGDADVLRKAMGKKQKAVLDKMKEKFIEGATSRGFPREKLEKIWSDWEAFASYAFNKSHSTCYALVAYQTGYLKANYPAEYMAALLSNNLGNIDKITFFLEECRRMGLIVKGPDVNESAVNFSVNKQGIIRYGLGAIKGVGEAAVESLIEEREKNGPFQDIYDFMRRANLRTINKRVLESLACAGAFDELAPLVGKDRGYRSQLFASSDKYESFLEHLLRYAHAYQEDKILSAHSLFGDLSDSVSIPQPPLPHAEPWNLLTLLQREREVVGFYLSGHPMDDYRSVWKSFATPISELENYKDRKVAIAGFVVKVEHRTTQKGSPWGRVVLQDYTGDLEISLFTDAYSKFRGFLEEANCLYVEGEYKPRYGSETYELRVSNIRMLESIGEEMARGITLRIPVEHITVDLIAKIERICNQHKGKHLLRMELIDFQNKERLTLASSSRWVLVSNELLEAIEKLGLEYTLARA